MKRNENSLATHLDFEKISSPIWKVDAGRSVRSVEALPRELRLVEIIVTRQRETEEGQAGNKTVSTRVVVKRYNDTCSICTI